MVAYNFFSCACLGLPQSISVYCGHFSPFAAFNFGVRLGCVARSVLNESRFCSVLELFQQSGARRITSLIQNSEVGIVGK